MSKVRVRFAPSPTGFVHIGGLRTALYNYLFAKKHSGTFVLRIEDTDRRRFVEDATENLLDVLEWAGIQPDEGPVQGGPSGPYLQSERTEIYKKYADQLLQKGLAYYAFDTPEELEAMRERLRKAGNPHGRYNFIQRREMHNSLNMSNGEVLDEMEKGSPYVIRLLVPENRQFSFEDEIRGEVNFKGREVDDQVLIKSDGFPTYHLANVVDDHYMEITHVIRGEEWLSSVPKHLLLYEYLNWQAPKMAHLPLIINPDGTKMSKRDITSLAELPSGKVDPDVFSYIKGGYEKEAVLNYIALLGWNPGEGDERQVFTLDELVDEFSIERVNKSAAIFDLKKLNWLNKEHLSKRSTDSLVEEMKPMLSENGYTIPDDDYLRSVVNLLKERIHFRRDLIAYGRYFFKDPDEYEEQAVKKRWKEHTAKIIVEFCEEIFKLAEFTAEEIEQALRGVAEKHEIGGGQIIHPVRLAVTGMSVGPSLFELLQVLGKETVLRRLQRAAEVIPKMQ